MGFFDSVDALLNAPPPTILGDMKRWMDTLPSTTAMTDTRGLNLADNAQLLTRLGMSPMESIVAMASLGVNANVSLDSNKNATLSTPGVRSLVRVCQTYLQKKGYPIPTADSKVEPGSATDYAFIICCGRKWRDQRWLEVATRVLGALPFNTAVEIFGRAQNRADNIKPSSNLMPLLIGAAGIGALVYFTQKGR